MNYHDDGKHFNSLNDDGVFFVQIIRLPFEYHFKYSTKALMMIIN